MPSPFVAKINSDTEIACRKRQIAVMVTRSAGQRSGPFPLVRDSRESGLVTGGLPPGAIRRMAVGVLRKEENPLGQR